MANRITQKMLFKQGQFRTKNGKIVGIGTVSSDSNKPEHVIPALLDTLEFLAPRAARRVTKNYPEFFTKRGQWRAQWTEGGFDLYDADRDLLSVLHGDLFQELDDLCPPDVYFGAHIGDAVDYGFWFSVDTPDYW